MDVIEESRKFFLEKVKNMPDVISHTERVIKYALFLCERENANKKIVEIAAILHDVGYCLEGFNNHSKNSVIVAKEFLEKFNEKDKEKILNAIDHHGREAKTTEEKIIQDSDALDRIGPIGIIRMIIHFYRDEKIVDTEKLIEKVKDIINQSVKSLKTESAKEIAKSKLLELNNFYEVLNLQLESNLYKLIKYSD